MTAEDRYDSLFAWYGHLEGVDWMLLKAQVKQESAFDPDAESPVGAKGLAQFMNSTWAEWMDGTPGIQAPPPDINPVEIDPRNPEAAIRAQAHYMAWLLKFCKGDVRRALASYNWGVGKVNRLLEATGGGLDMSRMPPETQNYIIRILQHLACYQSQGLASAPV